MSNSVPLFLVARCRRCGSVGAGSLIEADDPEPDELGEIVQKVHRGYTISVEPGRYVVTGCDCSAKDRMEAGSVEAVPADELPLVHGRKPYIVAYSAKNLGSGYAVFDRPAGSEGETLNLYGDWVRPGQGQFRSADLDEVVRFVRDPNTCTKCGRPLASVDDMRARTLDGKCFTRYAVVDEDAKSDCKIAAARKAGQP